MASEIIGWVGLLLQELVEDVAVATSSRHADLSWARRFAVASPRFIGRRSASTVLSQDCLRRPDWVGLPVLFFKIQKNMTFTFFLVASHVFSNTGCAEQLKALMAQFCQDKFFHVLYGQWTSCLIANSPFARRQGTQFWRSCVSVWIQVWVDGSFTHLRYHDNYFINNVLLPFILLTHST